MSGCPKTGKKCIFCVFACFRPDNHIGCSTLMPFASINPTDPMTNFAKKYWELTVLQNVVFLIRPFWIFFFQKNKYFCLIPWKAVKDSWVARMGRNVYDYPGLGQHVCTGLQSESTIHSMRHILLCFIFIRNQAL